MYAEPVFAEVWRQRLALSAAMAWLVGWRGDEAVLVAAPVPLDWDPADLPPALRLGYRGVLCGHAL
jgi:hypothetical protein